jgi:rubrerythrin
VLHCLTSKGGLGEHSTVSIYREVKDMLSKISENLEKVKKDEIGREILRVGIIAELDAINLYEQLAAITDNQAIKKVFLDIAREEKTHIGEFQTLLLREDAEQVKELEEGKKEVEELVGK